MPTTGPGAPDPLEDLLGPVVSEASTEGACWERGAAGEELTARLLAPLADVGWTVLHDRRVPGSPANIDHLAIGPAGIFVIDTKAWRGELRLLDDGQLWYGPVPFDEVLARLRWEAGEVDLGLRRRLDQPVAVEPVLCLHGPTLPVEPLCLSGVAVVTGASLLSFLVGTAASGQVLDPVKVGCTAEEIFPIR
ncbi:MAG: nuclease-related domain-containing protein [Actinomycetota bacterium]